MTEWAIGILGAVVGIAGVLLAGRLHWFKGSTARVEAKGAADDRRVVVLEGTVAALQEQNELLRQQNDDYRRREEQWVEERIDLRDRIRDVETDYRKLVLAITRGRVCVRADDCNEFDPGDRRDTAI